MMCMHALKYFQDHGAEEVQPMVVADSNASIQLSPPSEFNRTDRPPSTPPPLATTTTITPCNPFY